MLKAVKAVLTGVLGLSALVALTSVPAVAGGGCCDCYPNYGYGTGYSAFRAPRMYVYQPSPYYYNPPPPPRIPGYGYVYVDRGPAVIIERDRWRDRRWYGRW